MTDLPIRVSVKKSPTKLGRKIVQIHAGPTREVFAIHEDLLCAQSPYFRRKLQANRLPIEGDCPICHEELQPRVKEVVFCTSTCGGNIHADCLTQWLRKKLECPLCRTTWVKHTTRIYPYPDLDESSFAIYCEWVYSSHVAVGNALDGDEIESSNHYQLVSAYLLGIRLEDRKFCTAILDSFLELDIDNGSYPGSGAVQAAYKNTEGPCVLRHFLVDLYVAADDGDWFEEQNWEDYPAEFMKDLTIALFRERRQTQGWKLTEMKDKYRELMEAEAAVVN